MDNDLVDEYRLLYFPLHLGSGKKLFADGIRPGALRLTSTKTTSTGVVITTYEPAGPFSPARSHRTTRGDDCRRWRSS